MNYQSYLVMDSTKSFHVLKAIKNFHYAKSFQNRIFSGQYFPMFELNREIYSVNLRIQSKYGKIWTRKNSVFGLFSRSGLSKTMKNVISSKKLFSFSRYSDICIFILFLSTLSRFKRTKGSGIINDVMHWFA